ncbi:hypothetical protein F4808DRAFT_474965 [Astrocystis sublimbata]|nr:hypothetical protein F4808DRAFT_474965 [Astrocystis sublimbata]
MSEVEHSAPFERRPACDNCKTRKTKCDRKTPCSSCVTLDVACRTTHRASEKRQRVLLSAKYEDAVQDVNRQLADVKDMLQALLSNGDGGSSETRSKEASQEATPYTPRSMIDEKVPTLDGVREGYHGDTSFTSHAHQITTTLAGTLLPSELEFPVDASLGGTKIDQNKFDESGRTSATAPEIDHNDVGLGNIPLPPNEIVLKLLRLLKTEEQRFFVDLPLFDEDEFIGMCRDIYFATEPISLWTWICVNVGLCTLFRGLSIANCQRLGSSIEQLRMHTEVLRSNANSALRSLRLCSEPSMESCRALAVLANFYVKQGHSTIAWRLISGAARAALDLGLHRLPPDPTTSGVPKGVSLFWHIYTWEKALAMSCGKSPTIRHSDVTSGLYLLATPENRSGVLNTLYCAYVDMAVIMGDIQESLFSVIAQQSSQQVRLEHVKRLANRLLEIRHAVEQVSPDEPTWDRLVSSNLGGLSTSLHIILHSQLAIVYRFLPPEFPNSHPLQCSNECVKEARATLSILANLGETGVVKHIEGWKSLINTILCLVPLVPFIVLAGNAIATSSGDDLPLLSRIISVLQPVVESSPLVRKVSGACEILTKIADRVVSSTSPPAAYAQVGQDQQFESYAFPMGQQDWDSVMVGFEDYDSRALANIIEPCFANTYW